MDYEQVRAGERLTYLESGDAFRVEVLENASTSERDSFRLRVLETHKGLEHLEGTEFTCFRANEGGGFGGWYLRPWHSFQREQGS